MLPTTPTSTQLAYVALALLAGAIYASAVLLAAEGLRQRRARAAARGDAAGAVTSAWAPGWNAPTAPHPTTAAADPWEVDAVPTPPLIELDLAALATPPPEVPAVLPRRERRQRIDPARPPRNDLPAAAEPPRFVELVLTPATHP